jgi:hypothetical protein
MRHSAAENKIVRFPARAVGNRHAWVQDNHSDQAQRMPFGLCLVIWTALAVVGWSVFGAAAYLI